MLSEGMTYGEAVSIIGAQGVEQASSHTDAIEGVMEPLSIKAYSWQNADGSNMNAMFQNDRMMNKAQFGLR